MNEEHMMTASLDPQSLQTGKTDWKRIDAMTEEEITKVALSDADNPPISEEMLARFQRVPDVQEIRQKLALSQRQFSMRYHVPIRTLQEWEQRRSMPDTTAIAFLTAIANMPEAIHQALNGESK